MDKEYERYASIRRRRHNGVCKADADFYLAYCEKNGIDPQGVKVDESATPLADARYTGILVTLESGGSISQADYGYLWRHCRKTGKEMPPCKATYTLNKM